MALSFKFYPITEEAWDSDGISLNKLDEEVCKYFNIEVNKEEFSGPYLDLVTFAMSASYNAEGSRTSKSVIDEAIIKNAGGWPQYKLEFFKHFLNKYNLVSWR